MKKLMYLAVFTLTLGFTACGSDDDGGGGVDCITASSNILAASEAFIDSPSTENCNAYKTALENFLNNNCSPNEASETSLRQQLETLGDCTIL